MPRKKITPKKDKCYYTREEGKTYYIPMCMSGAVHGEDACICFTDEMGMPILPSKAPENSNFVNLTVPNLVNAYKNVLERLEKP